MRGNYPITRPKLHNALLELLNHPETTLRYGHMTAQMGLSKWDNIQPPTNITIIVDANAEPLNHLSIVVHELLHVLFGAFFHSCLSAEVEEIAILAYEADMYAYIKKSPKRHAAWTKALSAKLKKAPCES